MKFTVYIAHDQCVKANNIIIAITNKKARA